MPDELDDPNVEFIAALYYDAAEALRTRRVANLDKQVLLEDYLLFLPHARLSLGSSKKQEEQEEQVRKRHLAGELIPRPAPCFGLAGQTGIVLSDKQGSQLLLHHTRWRGWRAVRDDEDGYFTHYMGELFCDHDYEFFETDITAGPQKVVNRRMRLGLPPITALCVTNLGEDMSGRTRSFLGGACEKVVLLGEDGRRREILRYPCEFCDKSFDVTLRPDRSVNPDWVRGSLGQANWQIIGYFKKFRCPSCRRTRGGWQRHANPPTPTPTPTPPPIINMEPIMPPSESLSAANITPALRRKVLEELETHFDGDHGEFLGHEDDNSIASRLDIPRVVVAEIREQFLGPIKVVPHVKQLQADLEAARKLLAETEQKLLGEVATLQREHAQRLSEMESRIRNELNTIAGVIADIDQKRKPR